MPTASELRKAYDQGYKAAQDGKHISTNPYRPNSRRAGRWRTGYLDGHH